MPGAAPFPASASAMACMSATSSLTPPAPRRGPDAHQQVQGVFRIASHAVGKPPMRVRRKPKQLRALAAQSQDFGDDASVVVGAAVAASAVIGAPHGLAQIAA